MRLSPRSLSQAGLALWTALLLGSPYLLGMRPLGGSAACSLMYPLVACAMLAGMWLATRPTVRTHADGWASNVLFDVGIFFTALLVIPEWLNVALMGAGSNLMSAVRLAAVEGLSLPQALCGFSTTFEIPLALTAALACGMQTQLAAARAGAPEEARRNPSSKAAFRDAAAAVAFKVVGLMQPIAWIAWLPHGAYPLAPMAADVSLSRLLWDVSPLLAVVPLIEQLTLCACSLFDAQRRVRVEASIHPWCPSPSYPLLRGTLIGEILGYILIYAFPALRAATQTEALVFATAQAIIIAAIPFLLHAMRRNASRSNRMPGCDAQADATCQTAEPGEPFRDALLQRGLTDREADSVALSLTGLSSSQAAQALGIRASSVREYNRRACKKLGVSSLDGLRESLAKSPRQLQDATNSSVGKTAKGQKAAAISRCVTAMCLMVALLPIPHESLTQGDALSIVFGVLLGLAGVGPVQAVAWRHRGASRVIQPVLALLTGTLFICLLVLRLHGAPSGWGNGAIMLCAAVLIMAGLASLGRCGSDPSMPRFSFALGWAWSYAWLTASGAGLPSWATLAPLLTLDVGLVLSALAQGRARRASLVLTAFASAAFCLLSSVTAGLLLFGIATLLSRGEALHAEPSLQSHASCPPPSAGAFGIGLTLALLALTLWLNQAPLHARPASLITTASTVVIGSLITLIPLVECWKALSKTQQETSFAEVAPGDSRRMEGFLISKGLSPRQVDVALQAARGTSLEETGLKLNLSRTAVYKARKEAFSALGVHTAAELANLLRRAIQ